MTTPVLPTFETVKNNKATVEKKCFELVDIFIKTLIICIDGKLYRNEYFTFENKRFLRKPEYGVHLSINAKNERIIKNDHTFSSNIFGVETEERAYFWNNTDKFFSYIINCIDNHIQKYIRQYNEYYEDSYVTAKVTGDEYFLDYNIYFIYTSKTKNG